MVEWLDDYKFGFEKLEVWKTSIEFDKKIYNATQKFPQNEIYTLTSQMRRAAVSISSNIAEGVTKKSMKDQARFSKIAFGSLMEVLNQLILAKELNYINQEELNKLRIEAGTVSRQLNSLKNSQLRRQSEK